MMDEVGSTRQGPRGRELKKMYKRQAREEEQAQRDAEFEAEFAKKGVD